MLKHIWRALSVRILIAAMLTGASPAMAEVSVTFYSHEFGENFPHAFFLTKGSLADGTVVNGGYGFTATSISPAILLGKVEGIVKSPSAKYISQSNAQFTVQISDSKYAELMAMVTKWKNIPQKSYMLNKRNCVHFAEDALRVLGIKSNPNTKLRKKPRSFFLEVKALNPHLK